MKDQTDRPMTRRAFMGDSAKVTAGLVVGLGTASAHAALTDDGPAIKKTRSYNPRMEYRRLGKTGLWVSAVCLGGHWKRIDKVTKVKGKINPYNSTTNPVDLAPFHHNRHEVVSRCIEVGINCIYLAGDSEAEVYSKALRGRREKMYLAYSHPASEMRVPQNRNAKKLVQLLEASLKRCRLEYVDVWRCMAMERGGRHTQPEVEEMIKALDTARKQGKCRFTGVSTHDRKWAKMLIETYPDLIQVILLPYTAKSKALPKDSIFEAIKKHDVGVLAIKPFASNSLFKGDGSPDGPHAAEDDRRARMAIRYILSNPAVTAPIPGLISTHQVDNVVKAVQERRELDRNERAELEEIANEMWTHLPEDYQWLREWECV